MSRRIAQSAVNWASIAERVPANQKAMYAAFKSKSDKYMRRLEKKLYNKIKNPPNNSVVFSL